MNYKTFPKSCNECHDREWCDSYYGGLGCLHKDTIIFNIVEEERKMGKEIQKEDVVREPSHYKHGTFETIDEMIIAFGPQRTFDYCIMNAWKYRSRAPYKGNFEQDMDKANRYLEYAKQISDNNLSYLGPISLIKNKNEE